jgi:hypothetical protein
MNRYLQRLLVWLFPFYPLWIWFLNLFSKKDLQSFINFLWLPMVIYLIMNKNNRVPKYLIFLLLFTAFHIASIYYWDLLPPDQGWLYFFRSDLNIYACAVFFIIENTKFDDWFYEKMNRNILIVIIISTLVSFVQVTDPLFFFNLKLDTEMEYVGDNRIFSIYSWTGLNSLGITFPILIGIALSTIEVRKNLLPVIVLSGIAVAFLSKARYVMIAVIIVFSQLIFTSTISSKRKAYFVIILFFSVFILIKAAELNGYNIQEVVEDRILEKSNETEMGSAMARVTSYYVFLVKFPEHPWLGVGPKTRDDVVQLLGGEAPLIHVGYLSYLYFYGIVGASLLFLSLFFLLKHAWKTGKQTGFWGSFFGLLTFCFANATFVYFNLSESGIIIAVIYMKMMNDRQELENEKENSENEEAVAVQYEYSATGV